MTPQTVKVPEVADSVAEVTVDRWLKQVGDHVDEGEPLLEVVTDKVNAEIASPATGILLTILAEPGDTVPVGGALATIGETAISTPVMSAPQPLFVDTPSRPSDLGRSSTVVDSGAPTPAGYATGFIAKPLTEAAPASASVRRLADRAGVALDTITPSGNAGRVTRDDVLGTHGSPMSVSPTRFGPEIEILPAVRGDDVGARPAREAVPIDERDEFVRFTAIRLKIAEHMVRSLATSPHAWTYQEVDVTPLVVYRDSEKEGFHKRNGQTLNYLAMIAQVLTDALRAYPYVNSSWADDGALLHHYYNLGIAVPQPGGLIVPVVKDADKLGFVDLVVAINRLVERARAKQLRADDVTGGSFTLNNIGPTGSVGSAPIIHQPQAAILTTESIVRRPVAVGDGIAIRSMMSICLSFDHRLVDEMMAGQFLSFIRQRLEAWTPAEIRV